jgi:prepilin-type N-terminal cleavage/methylation domain-containing protein
MGDTNNKFRRGFTLIELMVTILIASFVFVGVSIVLADGVRGFKRMNLRVHGNVTTDAYVARLTFDRTCRKARAGSAIVDVDMPSLRVLYYKDKPSTSEDPDMYAEFYLNEDTKSLMLATGSYDSITGGTTEINSRTVAGNVEDLKFSKTNSKSVQMVMTLDSSGNDNADDDHSITVTCGSVMHN